MNIILAGPISEMTSQGDTNLGAQINTLTQPQNAEAVSGIVKTVLLRYITYKLLRTL